MFVKENPDRKKKKKKILPQVIIIITPSRRKLSVSLKQRYLKIYFSQTESGKDYGAEKMPKIKLTKVLFTNFNEIHHFCNIYVFGLFC